VLDKRVMNGRIVVLRIKNDLDKGEGRNVVRLLDALILSVLAYGIAHRQPPAFEGRRIVAEDRCGMGLLPSATTAKVGRLGFVGGTTYPGTLTCDD
jgi:hypothetical protein